MNIVFWNTNKKSINEKLKELIIEKQCDIIALAEYNDDENNLINELYDNNINIKKAEIYSCDRVCLLYNEKIDVSIEDDNKYYLSYNIVKDNKKFKLFIVHLPSKMWSQDNGEKARIQIREIKENIHERDNVIILGDFNVNPFEDVMISADSLSALPIMNQEVRTVVGKEFVNMYNPMWNLFGDFDGIPGTYYYNQNHYWNMFDQVILSYSMRKYFNKDTLQIIDRIGENKLIKNGKVDKNISDHLPIYFELMEG